MKPRESLHHVKNAEGLECQLIRHDGHLSLEVEGRQISAMRLSRPAQELAEMVTRPFRPAKKPSVLFLGVGLGQIVAAAREALPQEKANFVVCPEWPELPEWLERRFDPSPLADERVVIEKQSPYAPIPAQHAPYQSILADLDALEAAAPEGWKPNRLRWLRQLSDSMKAGGILGFLRDRRDSDLERHLRKLSCDPVYEFAPVSEKSKKNRVLYLARKGHYERPH